MVAIPIVLLVILVLFALMLIGFLVVNFISYIAYCRQKDKRIEKKLNKKYGTQENEGEDYD